MEVSGLRGGSYYLQLIEIDAQGHVTKHYFYVSGGKRQIDGRTYAWRLREGLTPCLLEIRCPASAKVTQER